MNDGKLVGVFAVDGGGTSGVCWWTGKLDYSGGLGATLRAGEFGFTQIYCGHGDARGEREGCEKISFLFLDKWFKWTIGGVAYGDRFCAVEEFVISQRVGSKKRVGLSSARIGGLLEGMLVRVVPGRNFARYPPSRTKAFATSTRLRDWGLWCRGAEHSRDAARVLALHVAVLMEG